MANKIYAHSGKGFYVGSCVIVVEPDLETAKAHIRRILDLEGLPNEELDIVEFKIVAGAEIEINNGDY